MNLGQTKPQLYFQSFSSIMLPQHFTSTVLDDISFTLTNYQIQLVIHYLRKLQNRDTRKHPLLYKLDKHICHKNINYTQEFHKLQTKNSMHQ